MNTNFPPELTEAMGNTLKSFKPGDIVVLAVVDPATGQVKVDSQNLPATNRENIARSLYESVIVTGN